MPNCLNQSSCSVGKDMLFPARMFSDPLPEPPPQPARPRAETPASAPPLAARNSPRRVSVLFFMVGYLLLSPPLAAYETALKTRARFLPEQRGSYYNFRVEPSSYHSSFCR